MTSVTFTTALARRRNVTRPNFWEMLTTALKVRAERRALSQMEPHMLNDIGISARDAQAEAARPIWDLPAGR